MDVFGHFWTFLDNLTFLDFFGLFWTFLDIYGLFGHLWTSLDIFGHFWAFLDSPKMSKFCPKMSTPSKKVNAWSGVGTLGNQSSFFSYSTNNIP